MYSCMCVCTHLCVHVCVYVCKINFHKLRKIRKKRCWNQEQKSRWIHGKKWFMCIYAICLYIYILICLCMCEPLSNLIVFGRFKGIASWGSLSVVWGRFLNKWVSPVKLISLPALTQRCMKELQVCTWCTINSLARLGCGWEQVIF